MSTRSMIAIKTDDGFTGTYHHWDGYPTALGEYLAMEFQNAEHGWDYLKNKVLSHSWSSLRDNECHCCGTMSDGRREPFEPYTHETDCWAEFSYVFEHDEKQETDFMHIMMPADGGGFAMPNSDWETVWSVDLNAELPDFEEIQLNIGG